MDEAVVEVSFVAVVSLLFVVSDDDVLSPDVGMVHTGSVVVCVGSGCFLPQPDTKQPTATRAITRAKTTINCLNSLFIFPTPVFLYHERYLNTIVLYHSFVQLSNLFLKKSIKLFRHFLCDFFNSRNFTKKSDKRREHSSSISPPVTSGL